eukprot:COSAG02_NODE_861_length_16429_cov_75.930680_19_plen_90_part_00
MFAAVGPLSASLGLVSNAKKAVDVFKEMTNVPDEGILLWRLLDSTSAPLELSEQLAARQETMPCLLDAEFFVLATGQFKLNPVLLGLMV